jgi:hypothetical protein
MQITMSTSKRCIGLSSGFCRSQVTDNSGEVILGKLAVLSNYMIVEIKSGPISDSLRILTESAYVFGGERVDHFCAKIEIGFVYSCLVIGL